MTAEIKSMFQVILQDPEFQPEEDRDRNEAAWEAAWKRYRQVKRNEKALTLVKHEKKRFHTHSKYGKIFKPISKYQDDIKEIINKQDYLMTGEKEGYPKWPRKIGAPSKFPPELKHELVEYDYGEQTPYKRDMPPKTALERLKSLNRKEEKEKL